MRTVWIWTVLMVTLLTQNAWTETSPVTVFYSYDATHLSRLNSSDNTERRRGWDELHLVSALQGLLNRQAPRLYIYWVGKDAHIDKFWLKKLQAEGEWMNGWRERPIASLPILLETFRNAFQGLVVYDERVPATSNIASTIAGIDSLLPVRYDPSPGSLYTELTGALKLPVKVRLINEDGTPMFPARDADRAGTKSSSDTSITTASTGSAKCDAYRWAVDHYIKTGKCNTTRLGYYPDAYWLNSASKISLTDTLLSNHDYFISQKGFLFDLSAWEDEAPNDDPEQPLGTDPETLKYLLHAANEANGGKKLIHIGGFTPWDQKYTSYTGGKHEGVPSEWHFLQVVSCFNAYIDADAPGLHAFANASFHQHYPLKAHYPQRNVPDEKTLRAKGYIDADGKVTSRTYVALYVGDYDSAAWLYQMMPEIWEDDVRGSIPLGWALNPNLADRFPFGLAYTRKTATANDTFVAGDNGAGYLNPGYLTPPRKYSGLPSGADLWEKHCTRYFKQWDLRMTGFVIDGYAPQMTTSTMEAYSRFSPMGIVTWRPPQFQGVTNDMPWLPMTSDLTGTPEEGAVLVAENAPSPTGFAIYRTILWKPSAHKRLYEEIRKLRPDIEIVEPHTLMLLLKRHLTSEIAH